MPRCLPTREKEVPKTGMNVCATVPLEMALLRCRWCCRAMRGRWGVVGRHLDIRCVLGRHFANFEPRSVPILPDNPWDSRLSPENARGVRLSPENAAGVRMLPKNAAGVPISPENARGVRMPPENAMPMQANGCEGGGVATERLPPVRFTKKGPAKPGLSGVFECEASASPPMRGSATSRRGCRSQNS